MNMYVIYWIANANAQGKILLYEIFQIFDLQLLFTSKYVWLILFLQFLVLSMFYYVRMNQ